MSGLLHSAHNVYWVQALVMILPELQLRQCHANRILPRRGSVQLSKMQQAEDPYCREDRNGHRSSILIGIAQLLGALQTVSAPRLRTITRCPALDHVHSLRKLSRIVCQ